MHCGKEYGAVSMHFERLAHGTPIPCVGSTAPSLDILLFAINLNYSETIQPVTARDSAQVYDTIWEVAVEVFILLAVFRVITLRRHNV